jgi:hypothetical protein
MLNKGVKVTMKLIYTITRKGKFIQNIESPEQDFHEYYLPSLDRDDEIMVTVFFDNVQIGKLFLKR